MGETVANGETILGQQELEEQKDEFLRRATALRGLLELDDLSCAEVRTTANITLHAPEGWKFSVFRKDGEPNYATTMGRFRDFDSSVGDKEFDSNNPLKADKITAVIEKWPNEDQAHFRLTFATNDRAYYDTYTSRSDSDELVINVERIEAEAS